MSVVDVSLIQQLTGQQRVTSVAEADADLLVAAAALREAQAVHRALARRSSASAARVNRLRLWVQFLRLPARMRAEPWAALLIASGLLSFFIALAFIFIGAGLAIVFAVTLLPFASLMPLMLAMRPGPIAKWMAAALIAKQAQDDDQARTDSAAARLATAQAHYARLKQIRDGVVLAWQAPLTRLLNADVRAMSGYQFEEYLGEVFRFLGFAVEHTGRSGDQGVDLIVTRGTSRIAVQAKCYSGHVSNSAVQQVFAGMTFYGCTGCAVVTSAAFTHSAIQIAQATGCRLIDGTLLPEMIRGRASVE